MEQWSYIWFAWGPQWVVNTGCRTFRREENTQPIHDFFMGPPPFHSSSKKVRSTTTAVLLIVIHRRQHTARRHERFSEAELPYRRVCFTFEGCWQVDVDNNHTPWREAVYYTSGGGIYIVWCMRPYVAPAVYFSLGVVHRVLFLPIDPLPVRPVSAPWRLLLIIILDTSSQNKWLVRRYEVCGEINRIKRDCIGIVIQSRHCIVNASYWIRQAQAAYLHTHVAVR